VYAAHLINIYGYIVGLKPGRWAKPVSINKEIVMKLLKREALQSLVEGAQLLEGTPEKPRVFLTKDQSIFKIFYPRQNFLANKFRPYAKRFVSNSVDLKERHVTAPDIQELYYITADEFPYELNAAGCYCVLYPCIPGTTVRACCQKGDFAALQQLPKFLAALHKKGVFFRPIHLANLLWQGDGQFALLDISTVHFHRMPLSINKRARNLKHLLAKPIDAETFDQYRRGEWLADYLRHTNLSQFKQMILAEKVLV
jgi:hypothetical protein